MLYKVATNTNPNNENIAEKYRAACGKLRPPLMKCANILVTRSDPIIEATVRTVSAAPCRAPTCSLDTCRGGREEEQQVIIM